MITVVLDANVLASGAIAATGTLAAIVDAWRDDRLVVFLSAALRVEVSRTLHEPYFQQRLTPELAARIDALIQRRARLTVVTVQVLGVATHPEDDQVLATAVSARVQYLVTGDAQLQKLGAYEGVAIVSPRQFLAILEADRES